MAGASMGAVGGPPGMIVGSLTGAIIGAIGGSYVGAKVTDTAVDVAESTADDVCSEECKQRLEARERGNRLVPEEEEGKDGDKKEESWFPHEHVATAGEHLHHARNSVMGFFGYEGEGSSPSGTQQPSGGTQNQEGSSAGGGHRLGGDETGPRENSFAPAGGAGGYNQGAQYRRSAAPVRPPSSSGSEEASVRGGSAASSTHAAQVSSGMFAGPGYRLGGDDETPRRGMPPQGSEGNVNFGVNGNHGGGREEYTRRINSLDDDESMAIIEDEAPVSARSDVPVGGGAPAPSGGAMRQDAMRFRGRDLSTVPLDDDERKGVEMPPKRRGPL